MKIEQLYLTNIIPHLKEFKTCEIYNFELNKLYQELAESMNQKNIYTALDLPDFKNIKEIKLSIVRGDYIYARSPFFRKGTSTKDVRVIVGRINDHGDDLTLLEKDIQFMESAKRSIQVAMDRQIAENRNELTKLMNNV